MCLNARIIPEKTQAHRASLSLPSANGLESGVADDCGEEEGPLLRLASSSSSSSAAIAVAAAMMVSFSPPPPSHVPYSGWCTGCPNWMSPRNGFGQ